MNSTGDLEYKTCISGVLSSNSYGVALGRSLSAHGVIAALCWGRKSKLRPKITQQLVWKKGYQQSDKGDKGTRHSKKWSDKERERRKTTLRFEIG